MGWTKGIKVKVKEKNALLEKLKSRFEENMERHKQHSWSKLESKFEANPHKLKALYEMEKTGGEPDVIGFD